MFLEPTYIYARNPNPDHQHQCAVPGCSSRATYEVLVRPIWDDQVVGASHTLAHCPFACGAHARQYEMAWRSHDWGPHRVETPQPIMAEDNCYTEFLDLKTGLFCGPGVLLGPELWKLHIGDWSEAKAAAMTSLYRSLCEAV